MKLMYSTEDFETIHWHDNTIHAFNIIEGDDGCSGDLRLDIDFIAEWMPPVDGRYQFKVSPADLIFHNVTGLKISIDYDSCSAALQPPTIHEIHRTPITYPNGYKSFKWDIEINWPRNSSISFDSTGFTQAQRKEAIFSESQSLPPELRLA